MIQEIIAHLEEEELKITFCMDSGYLELYRIYHRLLRYRFIFALRREHRS
jgi:hypothetical protein